MGGPAWAAHRRVCGGLYLPIQGELANLRVLAGLAVAAEAVGRDGFFVWEAVVAMFEHSDAVRERMGTSRAIADPVVAVSAWTTTGGGTGPRACRWSPLGRSRCGWREVREAGHRVGGRPAGTATCRPATAGPTR
ncbi:MAG: hypothetical protein ACRD2W_02910 [Acidimicrobiales bacterium]